MNDDHGLKGHLLFGGGVQVCDYLVNDFSFWVTPDILPLKQDGGRNVTRKNEIKSDGVVTWVQDTTLELKHGLLEVNDFLFGPNFGIIITLSLPFDFLLTFNQNLQISGRHHLLTADVHFTGDLVAWIVVRSIELDKDLATMELRTFLCG